MSETEVKVIIRTTDSYLVLTFNQTDAEMLFDAKETTFRLKKDADREVATISLLVMDLERNEITRGDVDILSIVNDSVVWMSTSKGCNYPPFRNQVNQ